MTSWDQWYLSAALWVTEPRYNLWLKWKQPAQRAKAVVLFDRILNYRKEGRL